MAVSTKNRVAAPGDERDHYLELIQAFPLRHLRSDGELAEAIRIINSLLDRRDLAGGERDYLDVLTDIVEKYEDETISMPAVSDVAMLRHLIDAQGIKQSKLASETRIPMSTISEILSGKRTMNRSHIAIFAKHFGVSQAVFLP